MGVSVEGPIFIRPYRGFEDPALPVAHWMAAEFVMGDASGGSADITINFKPGGQPLSGRLFNLEEITVTLDQPTTGAVNLQTINMDRFNLLIGPTTWDQAFSFQPGLFESTQPPDLKSGLPVFLGAAVSPATAAALQVSASNVSLRILRVRAMGYIWEARSILAVGGPQRPPSSLYG